MELKFYVTLLLKNIIWNNKLCYYRKISFEMTFWIKKSTYKFQNSLNSSTVYKFLVIINQFVLHSYIYIFFCLPNVHSIICHKIVHYYHGNFKSFISIYSITLFARRDYFIQTFRCNDSIIFINKHKWKKFQSWLPPK